MAKRNNLSVVPEQSDEMPGLKPGQLAWLDENLCEGRFKKYRQEADAARKDTDKARATMKRYEEQRT